MISAAEREWKQTSSLWKPDNSLTIPLRLTVAKFEKPNVMTGVTEKHIKKAILKQNPWKYSKLLNLAPLKCKQLSTILSKVAKGNDGNQTFLFPD